MLMLMRTHLSMVLLMMPMRMLLLLLHLLQLMMAMMMVVGGTRRAGSGQVRCSGGDSNWGSGGGGGGEIRSCALSMPMMLLMMMMVGMRWSRRMIMLKHVEQPRADAWFELRAVARDLDLAVRVPRVAQASRAIERETRGREPFDAEGSACGVSLRGKGAHVDLDRC